MCLICPLAQSPRDPSPRDPSPKDPSLACCPSLKLLKVLDLLNLLDMPKDPSLACWALFLHVSYRPVERACSGLCCGRKPLGPVSLVPRQSSRIVCWLQQTDVGCSWIDATPCYPFDRFPVRASRSLRSGIPSEDHHEVWSLVQSWLLMSIRGGTSWNCRSGARKVRWG